MSDHRRFRTRQRKSVLHANPFRVLFALALLCGTGATAATLSGTVTYSGGQTGTIYVQAFQSTGTVDLVSGLVAHYPFDGNADDASGNGNTATVHGASLTVDRFGITNGAYAFDGNDYIATPSLSLDTTTGLTLAGWARVDDVSVDQAFVGAQDDAVEYPPDTDPWNRHYAAIREGNYQTGAGNTQKYTVSATQISNDTWFFFAVTLDGSNAAYYVDGVEVDATPYVARGVCGISTYIGANSVQGTPLAFLHGAVDDVAIYGRALSPGEVQALYQTHEVLLAAPGAYSMTNLSAGSYTVQAFLDANTNGLEDADEASGAHVGNPVFVSNDVTGVDIELADLVVDPPITGSISGTVTYSGGQTGTIHVQAFWAAETPSITNGLVAYYPFNGNANDTSGNGNTGTVHGAALTMDRFGNRDSAYAFDGNDHIGVPNLISNYCVATLSAWICSTNPPEVDSFVAVSKPRLAAGAGLTLGLRRDTGQGGSGYHSSSGGWMSSLVTSNALNDGEWYHLCVTISGAESRLYLDGFEVDSAVVSGPALSTQPLQIGREFLSPPMGTSLRFFKGAIDDVRVYDRALAAKEVEALCWPHEVGIESPCAYSITNLLAGKYTVGAYLDVNGDGIQDADEASGEYAGNPVIVSNDVTGVDIELTDPDPIVMPFILQVSQGRSSDGEPRRHTVQL